MNTDQPGSTDPQDQQWLDALAGRPDPAADAKLNREALALRAALIARRQKLEDEVPQADDALLEKIRFRLRREGLDRVEPDSKHLLGEETAPVTKTGQKPWNFRAWGMAASVLIGIALVVQLGINPTRNSEDDVVRGDATSTNLIVDDPQARLAELVSGLKAAGLEPNVKQLGDGRVLLKTVANDASREYLLSQRIEGKEKDGMIVLLLSKKPSK